MTAIVWLRLFSAGEKPGLHPSLSGNHCQARLANLLPFRKIGSALPEKGGLVPDLD